MDRMEVQGVLSRIDQQLSCLGSLDPVVEQAVDELLNLIEQLVSGQQALAQEVQRLKAQLHQKKKNKTTGKSNGSKSNSDHSSEKHRQERNKSKRQSAGDRRTFKDLTIHETIECPVDPKELPSDAVRV
jgi:conjugal transfer/entry exclusion protein